jgi:hypothetical protein
MLIGVPDEMSPEKLRTPLKAIPDVESDSSDILDSKRTYQQLSPTKMEQLIPNQASE